MDEQLIQELKQQLLNEKEELEEHIKSFESETDFMEGTVGELNSYDQQHPGDFGTELYEREKDMAFKGRANEQLEEIEHALHKIENGTYGICERTGQPIPNERLKAMPTARYVIDENMS
ncbi:TraR/DksA C4-type zinc finger protein [Tenuibacillus multivorans]|uniref:RNA polymerase-binding protein DksA n=1 Tax=Tenuibacillus multivorans TaxID=237069 RepID=A0A1H0FRP5_9BACI|nr:TraR/DksA C4-type zinc finger protein [Tenuibacillus multivorans]GEL77915.1 hypothetical protein TMU01_21500 [Tenuibacillus multivorans]SDN97212.1 RNA polymerase-binding protein DksA [Tenuibacillus multivorans]